MKFTFKKLALGMAGAAVILTTAACGSKKTETPAKEPAKAAETKIEISHSLGTTSVAPNPKKTVVFDYGILDIMDALKVKTELAAPVEKLPSYLKQYENSVNAGSVKEPNLEAIYEFAPDVIFISGRQKDYYEELSKIAPTVYVDLNAASYLNDFTNNVKNVAKIYDKAKEADSQLAEIQKVIEKTKVKTTSTDKKALILLTNDGSMSAYGTGSRFGLIHDVLGIPAADPNIEVSTHGQEASYEYVAQVNPDIIYVVDRTAVVGGTQMASSVMENELIQSTTAAKESKIIYLNAENWYLSGGGITSLKSMVEEAAAALN